MRHNATERLGVVEVEKLFLQFNWIPRTIFQTDVGIDMTVEICKNGNPTGQFIGVQIKSGESYFKEKSDNSIVFRSDKTHIDYWINNSLPILIILHSQKNKLTIWQVVNKQTVEYSGKNFKIKIPLTNILESKFSSTIEKLTEKSPLLNNFQKLLMDKPIINLLKKGEKVVVELGMWVNKSSGRADIKVFHVLNDSELEEYKEEEEYYLDDDERIEIDQELLEEFSAMGVHSYQSLYYFYKWANFNLDESFYETFSDYDEDEMPGYKLVFIDDRFRDYKLPIIPYHNNGEIAYYRLVMTLNEFGYSILEFLDYLSGNKQLELNFN